MRYAFAAIVEQEDVDEVWLPRVVDKHGNVAWVDDEGPVRSFRATGLTVHRGSLDRRGRMLELSDVDGQLHVSRGRLVLVVRKYDKGGGWIGGVGAMVVLNAVSKARAAVRSHGKFLVGQVRWPWLHAVGYIERRGWGTSAKLRLTAQDGETGQWIYVDVSLHKSEQARDVAAHILDLVRASRRASGAVSPEDRDAADHISLPAYDASARQFAVATVPGSKKALATTAYPPSIEADSRDADRGPPAGSDNASREEAMPTVVRKARSEVVPATPASERRGDLSSEVKAASAAPIGEEVPDAPRAAGEALGESAISHGGDCEACGAALTSGAKFCRACGAAVDQRGGKAAATRPVLSTTKDHPSAWTEAPGGRNQQEGQSEGLRAGPRGIREAVGVDVAASSGPLVAPPTVPATHLAGPARPREHEPASGPASSGGGHRLIGALVVFAAVGIVAVAALLVVADRRHSNFADSSRPRAAGKARQPTGSSASVPGAVSTPGAATTGPDQWPVGVSAYTVQLASMRVYQGAQTMARAAQNAGLDARILRSSNHAGLSPGYWVVYLGQFPDRSAAASALTRVHVHGFQNAYARYVTSAVDDNAVASDSTLSPTATRHYERAGYTIDLPSDRVPGAREVAHAGQFTESRWHPAGRSDVTLLVDDTPGFEGTAETGAAAVRRQVSQVPGYEELRFAPDEVAGAPAWRWSFVLKGARKSDWFTSGCDTGYAILGAAPVAEFAAYADAFKAAVATFSPTCGDPP